MEEKIRQVRISFRPPAYREGTVARIVGDFTDWVPVTMHMHTVREAADDPGKKGEFFVEVKLVKGYRYRYLFEVDSSEVVSDQDPKSANASGKVTNYIEVGDTDAQMTVEDFISRFSDGGQGEEVI